MKSEGLARSGAQRRFFELHADTCHRQQRQFVSRRFHDYTSKHFNHSRILRVLHSSALALCLRPASGGGTLVPTDVYLDGLTVTIPNQLGWARVARKKLLEMTGELPNPDGHDNADFFGYFYGNSYKMDKSVFREITSKDNI